MGVDFMVERALDMSEHRRRQKNASRMKIITFNARSWKKLGLGRTSLSFNNVKATNTMHLTRLLLAFLALCILPLPAADSKPVTYIAEMSGMVCAGCKEHVTASFTKLEGVSKVLIVVGEKPRTQKVTVISSKDSLTKEQAVAALGTSSSTYIVHTWKKAE